MSIISDIKDRIDPVKFYSEYVPSLKKTGRYFSANCVFHQEKSPSFFVFPDSGNWRCFGACGEGGDTFSFYKKLKGLDDKQAIFELAQKVGISLDNVDPEKQRQIGRLRALMECSVEYYHNNLKLAANRRAFEYTVQRGLSTETLKNWRIGYATSGWKDSQEYLANAGFTIQEMLDAGVLAQESDGQKRVYDRFRERLMIPICDSAGHVVSFGGRLLADRKAAKYINGPQSPLFDKGALVFGLDKAKATIRQRDQVIVVEGYMDAIAAHQAGYSETVAQMGTALTDEQAKTLTGLSRHIILALDGDEAGQKATRRGIEIAAQIARSDRFMIDLSILQLPDGCDPDKMIKDSPSTFADLLIAAKPAAQYLIELGVAHIGSDASALDKETLAKQLLPTLVATEHDMVRQTNVQLLARALHINERTLLEWSSNGKKAARPKAAQQQRYNTSAIEQTFMAIVSHNPRLMYSLHRLFREQDLPLFCADDLTQSDYQALWTTLEQANEQDDLSAPDFVRATNDLVADTYNSLLEMEVSERNFNYLGLWLKRQALINRNQELEIYDPNNLFESTLQMIAKLSQAIHCLIDKF